MSISKICIPNFVFVLRNERHKTYQTGMGHAPGVGLWGTGVPRGSNNFFFKHGHVAYQIDGDDEQNKMQVQFSSWRQTGDLGARSKGQISLTCQFERFLYQTLCVFSQIKDRNHIEQNFYSVAKVMPRGGTAGCWGGGVNNFSLGICDGATSTANSSFYIKFKWVQVLSYIKLNA